MERGPSGRRGAVRPRWGFGRYVRGTGTIGVGQSKLSQQPKSTHSSGGRRDTASARVGCRTYSPTNSMSICAEAGPGGCYCNLRVGHLGQHDFEQEKTVKRKREPPAALIIVDHRKPKVKRERKPKVVAAAEDAADVAEAAPLTDNDAALAVPTSEKPKQKRQSKPKAVIRPAAADEQAADESAGQAATHSEIPETAAAAGDPDGAPDEAVPVAAANATAAPAAAAPSDKGKSNAGRRPLPMSSRKARVVGETPTATSGVKVVYFIKRKPNTTQIEMAAYWLAFHISQASNHMLREEAEGSSPPLFKYTATIFDAPPASPFADFAGGCATSSPAYDAAAIKWFAAPHWYDSSHASSASAAARMIPPGYAGPFRTPFDAFMRLVQPYDSWATTEYVLLDPQSTVQRACGLGDLGVEEGPHVLPCCLAACCPAAYCLATSCLLPAFPSLLSCCLLPCCLAA